MKTNIAPIVAALAQQLGGTVRIDECWKTMYYIDSVTPFHLCASEQNNRLHISASLYLQDPEKNAYSFGLRDIVRYSEKQPTTSMTAALDRNAMAIAKQVRRFIDGLMPYWGKLEELKAQHLDAERKRLETQAQLETLVGAKLEKHPNFKDAVYLNGIGAIEVVSENSVRIESLNYRYFTPSQAARIIAILQEVQS